MDLIRFHLNGREVSVRGVDPHTTLLQYLRREGLTGAKEGCAEGECGACAVVLVHPGPDGGPRYVSCNSCLLLLPALAGQEVYTVEALAQGETLHPVQETMVRHGGSQCGYCTPGFVMSLFAAYYRPGRTGFDDEVLSGNLCRCTGYRPIRDAARELLGPEPDDPFLKRLQGPAPRLGPVTYQGSGRLFYRPTRLRDVLSLLAEHPGARLVAGATDIAVEVNQREARWPVVISLEAVGELRVFEWSEHHVEIGAGLTLSEIEERLRGRLPLLEQLFPLFASHLIRNRATLGGNLATASPISDSAPVLLALGAEVRVASERGERVVPLSSFYTGYRRTVLQPDEVLLTVRIPLPLPRYAKFYKVAKRRRDDISTVSAAFALDLDAAGRVSGIRLAYGGVAAMPVRAFRAEATLLGKVWCEEAVAEVLPVLRDEFQPISDHRGSAEYRKALITRLFEKFYHETGGTVDATRR